MIVILWAVLTTGYIGTGIGLIVMGRLHYCFDTSRLSDDIGGKVVYWAKKYEGTPPLNYSKPEELGISKVIHHGYDDPDGIDIVILNEPFPLRERQPIFKWNERFYQISDEPGPFYKSSPCPQVQVVMKSMQATGSIILVGWLIIVYYHLKEKKVNT